MSEQLDEGIAQVHRYDVRLCVADTPVLNHRLGQRVEGRKKGYMNAITERVWYECEGLLLIARWRTHVIGPVDRKIEILLITTININNF